MANVWLAQAHMNYAKLSIAFVAGIVAAIVSQAVTGWWLNSGNGVAVMLGMLAALSLVLIWLDRHAPIALWIGVVNGTTFMLFFVVPGGPGNIFPLVMAVAAVMSAVAILPGWLLRNWRLLSDRGAMRKSR